MTTEVFDAAVSVARKVGYRNVTRRLIAEKMAEAGEYKDRPQQAMNFLINEGKMGELIKQLVEAKDRLALVPGSRVGAAPSAFWRVHDKSDLVNVAYRLASDKGLLGVTMVGVAELSGFSRATLNNYFKSLDNLRSEIIAVAVKHQNLRLCGQAVASGLPCADLVPNDFRQAALKSLA